MQQVTTKAMMNRWMNPFLSKISSNAVRIYDHLLGYGLEIESISDQSGYPKNHSSVIVEILLEIIKKALESGDDVLISGFGKFCVKDKKERKGRNPATGEDMILEPRKTVTFRCSQRLRDRING
jgi:integration host factor subunit alpha